MNAAEAVPGDQASGGGVVVIVASLGGLEAAREVLKGLPGDFPLPVLLVLHLARGHRSRAAEILDRAVALPVSQARDGERIVPGHVYVAPPDRHLTVDASGRLALLDSPEEQYVRPSGNVLFRSAAAYGRRAIGVVLTGLGRDGAAGVRALKAEGAVIVAQDEASARAYGMPGSAVETGDVDHLLPLDRIAGRLVEITRPPPPVA